VTIDAIIVATAEEHQATDILTTDPRDIRSLASRAIHVIAL
jgi:predicted nucleic acid-binding protein